MIFTIFSLIPFIFLIYLLVFKKVSSSKVMFLTYFLTFFILLFIWKIRFVNLFISSFTGFIKAIDIFLIIFFVLVLYNLLKINSNLEILKDFFKKYTKDKNILLILIGFFFVSFFESIAGFGTPAAICAPILVFLGFSKKTSVIITLIADSVSVPFGAFGTPIIGGLKDYFEYVGQINYFIGTINFFVCLFLPIILLFVYYKIEKKSIYELRKYLRFCFFSGFSFGLFYVIGAYFIGSEIPSILASVFGLICVLFMLDRNYLIDFKKNKILNKLEIFKSYLPYFVLIFFLIISRVFLKLKYILQNLKIDFNYFGINASLNLYSPWFLIFLTFLIFAIIYKINKQQYKIIFFESFNKSKNALFTLIFTLMFVQLLINSENLEFQILSIPNFIGNLFLIFGDFYIIFSPFLGAFGAFISGSATVSNIIFSPLQYQISSNFNFSLSLILALQTIGAGVGNMIAIHNILAVSTLVGLKNYESKIIKTNLLVVFFYCLFVGILGFLINFLS